MTDTPSTDPRCPACDERDLLQGMPLDDDIEVACGRCGHTWRRRQRTCATCGGSALVERDQYLSRNPRGNQTAVVGRRLVRLCPICDREALTLADRRAGILEEEYVSRYLVDPRALPALPPPQPTAPPDSERSPTERPAGHHGRRPRASESPPPHAPQRHTPGQRSATPADPTLREAISSFLEGPAEPGDAVVMLLVGRALGPTTRLSALGPDITDEVFSAGGGTPSARRTASRAVDHWRAQGWPA
jgi:Zn ribbon nucleic-acid-binding protein